jgi:2-iminobutanoate/2-iminopropanoate deaminase
MTRRAVSTGNAPGAVASYSQAIATDDLVFCAGQIGLDPATGDLVDGFDAQAEQVLRNLAAVLDAAGCTWADVVKTTCFLADLNDFAAFNAVYGRYLGADAPPRSTVQVAKLPMGSLVEVECVALAP